MKKGRADGFAEAGASDEGRKSASFSILHSTFDILHFGFCTITKTEMSNVE
ncbi:MAG: hypothetical protein WC538_23890 [Thermoanaerobaculia bacterium]|jgi:hypothetical protein